jgi:hypothetical protein
MATLSRPVPKWEDPITIYIKETDYEDVDRIRLAQDTVQGRAVVDTVMILEFQKL